MIGLSLTPAEGTDVWCRPLVGLALLVRLTPDLVSEIIPAAERYSRPSTGRGGLVSFLGSVEVGIEIRLDDPETSDRFVPSRVPVPTLWLLVSLGLVVGLVVVDFATVVAVEVGRRVELLTNGRVGGFL